MASSALHETDLLLASANEPLLEAESEAFVAEANAPPLLKGKWKSLRYRQLTALRFSLCTCIMFVGLIALEPMLRDLMYTVVCDSIGVDTEHCAQSDVANTALARFYAWNTVASALLMLVMIPLVTGISQRFGYRAGLLWSGTWLSIEVLATYVLIFRVPRHWTYWRMLVLTLVEAVAGSFTTILNTQQLLIFQLFPEPDVRPRYTSYSEGLLGVTGTFAPSVAAFLGRKYGLDRAILGGAVCVTSSLAFAVFMGSMPEFEYSQPSDADSGTKRSLLRRAVGYVRAQMAGLSVLSFGHCSRATRITALVLVVNRVLTSEILQGGGNALLMYSKQYFGWDNKQFGVISTALLGSVTFWGLCGFPLLQKWLLRFYKVDPLGVDQVDYRLLVASSFVKFVGFIGVSVSQTSWQLMFWITFKTQSALMGPTMLTSLMKLVPTSEGASLITAVTLLDTACSVVIPGVIMQIYKVTLSWWPRLIFELETLISGIQLITIIFFVKVVTNPRPATP